MPIIADCQANGSWCPNTYGGELESNNYAKPLNYKSLDGIVGAVFTSARLAKCYARVSYIPSEAGFLIRPAGRPS